MLARPDSYETDLSPMQSVLSMPYTLTPGRAAGTFLAEIGKRRIVGCRFKNSGKVVVPAEDFCSQSGDSEFDFVEAPSTGTLTAFTETAAGIIGLICIDGSNAEFAHRIVEASYDDLTVGDRVEVVWADEVLENSILNIRGFRPAAGAPKGKISDLKDPAEPLEVIPYQMDLHYEHAFGPYYGRMFDEIKHNRRIMGVKCPEGDGAYLPPREVCDVSHLRTGIWVDVKDTGTVRGMSVIHLEFVGQKLKPPYIYAEIKLDGASTRLIHTVRVDDMERAKELVGPGTRVKAVWADSHTGSMEDISHFEVIDNEQE